MSRLLDSEITLTLVIPCYNEEAVLDTLVERVRAAAAGWPCRWEVLLVDDGSSDGTWAKIQQLHQQDQRWQGIRLSRNFGHQLALWTGLRYAQGDIVAVLDADLQDPPELVSQFLQEWQAGWDVVYAVRARRQEGFFKRIAYKCFYRLLAYLAEIPIPLDSGDFCLMDRCVVQAMLQTQEQEPFVRGIRAWVGFRQKGVPYERPARAAGEPKYTLSKLVRLGLSGILSFSIRPLRVATWFGLLVSVFSFLVGIFTLIQRIWAEQFARIGLGPVPGFATIVCGIFFLGGVQLVCLGILGEYIGRIYENVKGRPHTIVAETLGLSESAGPPCQRPLA
ncbi:MAG: glycosyltransferase family 2 protein [Thermoguttaceae bacterium]|nr:glycosyltransferase family 2 protein [Thermoguttaceae bacterium]MDW8038199.1 glycosyltransferase family 2 protein [Thermoguttaceae bacterium]